MTLIVGPIISFPCGYGYGVLLFGKTQKKHSGRPPAHGTRSACSSPTHERDQQHTQTDIQTDHATLRV